MTEACNPAPVDGSRPRAVFLDALSLGPVDLAPIEPWCELQAWPSTAVDQRFERLRGAEIAITNKIPLDGALLRQLPQLRLICVAATGTDQIDHAACQELGIRVHNAGRYSRASVVQITWALILELCCAMDQRRRDLR
ncbi:MAG: glycerate dehydrogenase, partial [Synechococcus sp.]|nr:glycerate dehydrogenase [Synechococcus sp.]